MSRGMFDERFNRDWGKEDFLDRHPVLSIMGAGLFVIILNLIFWGALIAGVFFGLNHFGVI